MMAPFRKESFSMNSRITYKGGAKKFILEGLKLNDHIDSKYLCVYVCMSNPLITTLMNFQTLISRFVSPNVN